MENNGASAPSAKVNREQVRHVAALASLELTGDEEARFEGDLNAILGYFAELEELDTAGVAPMAQVSEILPRPAAAPVTVLREDEPRPSLDRAVVMSQAPATDGTFFKVPKVIER
jgi:aspartyl-tRNA(Asn)/glutamyl-tRNA(Gln) amidotransferase subunit C